MKKGFSFTSHHTLSVHNAPVLSQYVSALREMLKNAAQYDKREQALWLPLDPAILRDAKKTAKRYGSSKLKYVIVIGIGGSNLGTKAIYDALRGSYDCVLSQQPKLLFLDTISNAAIIEVCELLRRNIKHSDEVLLNLISKSGTTTESVGNFELLHEALKKHFPDIASRIVCTTDEGSALWNIGRQLGFGLLPVPSLVGGRFSVFSSVGIFPLLLAGIDVGQLRLGGAHMLEAIISRDRHKNYAQRSAEELFAALRFGYTILNIFHFNPELESLGKWERQLIAESLGKERDLAGKTVHAGITPIVSIGSTDLHSMAQLYLGGPRDKFTMLVRAEEKTGKKISPRGILSPLVKGISQKSATEIMDAIYGGILSAYQKHRLPVLEVRLPAISAYTLGAYMEWRMATVLCLAKLMNVDPFDQPNVEDYKKFTRSLLERKNRKK